MMNTLKTVYIENLIAAAPNLDDQTIMQMLQKANWPPEDIAFSLARYHEMRPSAPPATSHTQAVESAPTISQNSVSPMAPDHNLTPGIPAQVPKHQLLLRIFIATLVCVVVGVAGYLIVQKSSLFSPKPVPNDELLDSIYTKLSEVNTATYSLESSLSVMDRQAEVASFPKPAPLTPDEQQKYLRDQDRFRDIQNIMSALREDTYDIDSTKNRKKNGKYTYPATLGEKTKLTDPLGVPYGYEPTDNGTNYTLRATFETQEAFDAASNRDNATGSKVPTDTKTIILTSHDFLSSYLFTGKPAKPKLFGAFDISGIDSMISPSLHALISLGGTINNTKGTADTARMSIHGDATFGDANFTIDLEGIKKEKNYYGIVHKIPAIVTSLDVLRGKWISVAEESLGDVEPNDFVGGFLSSYLPSEKNITKSEIDKRRKQVKQLIRIAKEEKLFTVTSVSAKEGEKDQRRYQLTVVKGSVLPFYQRAARELESYQNDALFKYSDSVAKEIQHSDFDKLFEYFRTNSSFYIRPVAQLLLT